MPRIRITAPKIPPPREWVLTDWVFLGWLSCGLGVPIAGVSLKNGGLIAFGLFILIGLPLIKAAITFVIRHTWEFSLIGIVLIGVIVCVLVTLAIARMFS